jgi:hypothetical protein
LLGAFIVLTFTLLLSEYLYVINGKDTVIKINRENICLILAAAAAILTHVSRSQAKSNRNNNKINRGNN